MRRRAFVWIVLLALAGSSCRQASTEGDPSSPTASPVAPTNDSAPRRGSRRTLPPQLRADQLEQRAQTLRKDTDLSGIPPASPFDQPGALVYAPEASAGRVVGSEAFTSLMGTTDIPAGRARVPVGVHDLLLARLPKARVAASGKVTLRARTLHPTPGASIYFGITLPQQRIAIPRRRKHGQVKLESAGRTVLATFDLKRLLSPKVDVGNYHAHGRGVAEYRLELLDPRYGTSRLYDGRIAFRCAERPCASPPRFVQLPTIVAGPVVDLVTPNSAVISWDTDRPTRGMVVAIDPAGKELSFISTVVGVRHEVKLRGLAPDHNYRYYALALDRRGEHIASSSAVFLTAPRAPRPFTFAVMSDSRSGIDVGDASYLGVNARVLQPLLQRAIERSAELVLFGGDLVDGYTTSPGAFRLQLEAWKRTVQPFGAFVPIYEAMGNHEALIDAWASGWAADKLGDQSAEAVFASAFVNPRNGPTTAVEGAPSYSENVYSFDYGNTHFAVVNSNYWFRSHYERSDHPRAGKGHREGTVTLEQVRWLDRDLAEARKRGLVHLFVVTHEPAFPNGGHVQDAMYWNGRLPQVIARRNLFWNTLHQHRVRAAFFGDEHNYSRTLIDASVHASFERPVWQVISGGAGAPYYAANKSVPWSNKVRAFSAQQHLVLVNIDGGKAELEAVSLTGQLLDRWELTQH
jgi:hypothetical protein